MRLLNVETLALETFNGREIPEYAILSHTWREGEEVTFEELGTEASKSKSGYVKIQQVCKIAAEEHFSHVWIDTCCIDKRSSSELSEAINSMFNWYKGSAVCYAHLEDVFPGASNFGSARWFNRGWTLQELIAPWKVVFYSADWTRLGYKCSEVVPGAGTNLISQISRISGVDEKVLANAECVPDISVARRMSWASRRYTTRVEDEAYCLMGLFGIHMPLLYGEGGHAFARLQQEILKESADHSLFAWLLGSRTQHGSAFASRPADFARSADVLSFGIDTQPSALTNKGLSIRLALLKKEDQLGFPEYIGILNCSIVGRAFGFVGVILQATANDNQIFKRKGTTWVSSKEIDIAKMEDIYILSDSPLSEHMVKLSEIRPKYVIVQTTLRMSLMPYFEFGGIYTLERRWDHQIEDMLIQLHYTALDTYDITAHMVALYYYLDVCYAIVVGCNLDANGFKTRSGVTIVPLPIGDRLSREDEIRKILQSRRLISLRQRCEIEAAPFGILKASITPKSIMGEDILVLKVEDLDDKGSDTTTVNTS